MSLLDKWRDKYSNDLIPMQVTFELTYHCNERCGHCYLSTFDDRTDGRPTLKLEEWKTILDQLAHAGTLYLILIGGEAMMHPQFWAIAEHAAQRNFAQSLITNGLLLDDAAAQKIAELGFFQVALSLYSLDPQVHDRMTRRQGSHARILAAIDRLRRNNVRVTLNCLLTNQNIDDSFALRDWATAENLQIGFDPLVTAKNNESLDSTVTRATAEQLSAFYREQKRRGFGPLPLAAEAPDAPVCNAGRGKCAVNPYGDLLTCLEVRESIGNLRKHTFDELWHSPQAEKLRGYKVRDLKFDPSCGDGAFCDHCPGMAGAEVKDRMAPVPFLMEVARIKREVFEEI